MFLTNSYVKYSERRRSERAKARGPKLDCHSVIDVGGDWKFFFTGPCPSCSNLLILDGPISSNLLCPHCSCVLFESVLSK
jgi:ribosomal protein S27E